MARSLPLALILVAFAARTARAQCEANASSCVDCHEVRGLRPVLDDDRPWHRDHGFGDLCASCHGGDPAALDASGAHAALLDPRTSCEGCHAGEDRRYEAAAAEVTTPSAPPPPPPRGPGAATLALAAVSVALAGVIALQLVRTRAGPRRTLVAWLRAPTWSPYVAGAGLGVVVACCEVLLGRTLTASAAFDKLSAYPGRALFGAAPYYAHVMSPGVTWPVWLMIGVLLGAFASSALSGQARLRLGRQPARRLAVAFVGGALVQLGAGIAGGCTSGLALSGGVLLAPAAFVFMAAMFASGIPTAWLIARRRR